MLKNRFIKEQLGFSYSLYNCGKSKTQRKRNRRLGYHIIRQTQKRELKKEIENI